jgi:hypothetical protein
VPLELEIEATFETGQRMLEVLVADNAPGADHVRNNVDSELIF